MNYKACGEIMEWYLGVLSGMTRQVVELWSGVPECCHE